jgi:hypothetical protein
MAPPGQNALITYLKLDRAEADFVRNNWQLISDMAKALDQPKQKRWFFETAAAKSARFIGLTGLLEEGFRSREPIDPGVYMNGFEKCAVYACMLQFYIDKAFRSDMQTFLRMGKHYGIGDLPHLAYYIRENLGQGSR